MSLLWRNILCFSIGFKRPSPKHNIQSRFAQSRNFTQNIQFPLFMKSQLPIEGTSLFASREKAAKVLGSMTVEAAVVLPLFLFFFLNLGSAMEMIRLHSKLQLALWQAGNPLAVYGQVLEEIGGEDSDGEDWGEGTDNTAVLMREKQKESIWADAAGVALSYVYVKDRVKAYLGEDYLNASPLKDGTDSLHFTESGISESEDCFEIVMTYQVRPLGRLSGFWPFRMANKYYGHFWNGYAVGAEADTQEYVYVTENGEVYHEDRECTYLMLSVKQVSLWEARDMANQEGEKYRACDVCCDGLTLGQVYITEQGDCYHYRKSCLGLKRTVYKITRAQADVYRGCSRCVGGN